MKPNGGQRHVEVHKIQAPDTQTNTQLKQQHVAEEMLLLNTAIFYTLHSFPTTILIVNNILEFLLLVSLSNAAFVGHLPLI